MRRSLRERTKDFALRIVRMYRLIAIFTTIIKNKKDGK